MLRISIVAQASHVFTATVTAASRLAGTVRHQLAGDAAGGGRRLVEALVDAIGTPNSRDTYLALFAAMTARTDATRATTTMATKTSITSRAGAYWVAMPKPTTGTDRPT
jgi:hypothetical protein